MAKSYAATIRTDLVRLEGYRFASASETSRRYSFDEGLVKALSGCDVITARAYEFLRLSLRRSSNCLSLRTIFQSST